MRYSDDSAGGIMKDRFIALPTQLSVAEGLDTIRKKGEEAFQGASYVYIVDDHQKLTGIVSIRDLVFRPSSLQIKIS